MSIASESGARCCDDAGNSGVVTGREQFIQFLVDF